MALWNLWHGCHKISPGCQNCYVYRQDARHGKDSSVVTKTASFDLPVKRDRYKNYKLPSGSIVYTCFTSDFFLEDADSWRAEAWGMIRTRSDLRFLFITKRIHRFYECIPADWGDGYPNVAICCTAENQDRADFRLPIFLSAPIRHKEIICEPLLERIDLSAYLGPQIKGVTAGGESGPDARPCNYDWILDLREQCVRAGVPFRFKQTGKRFIKDGKMYLIERKYQHSQAKRAGINYRPGCRKAQAGEQTLDRKENL